MKKKLIFCLQTLSVFLLVTTFESCGPDEPQHPPPTIERKVGNIINMFNETGANVAPGGHPCPQPGTGCTIIFPYPPPINPPALVNEVNIFKSYYNSDNLSGYFSYVNNYSTLFPQLLHDNSGTIQNLISGEYKVSMPNGNTILVYQGELTDANVIFAVFVNFDNIP